MAQTTPGIEIYLSSEKAIEGANRFRVAVEAVAKALELMGVQLDKVDAALTKVGKQTIDVGAPLKKIGENAAVMSGGLDDAASASKKLGEALGSQGQSLGKATDAQNAFNAVGRTSARTFAILEVATGQSFAQVKKFTDAFATLSSVVRANPLIALGTAAAAVVGTFLLFGSSSDEVSEKAKKQAEEVKKLEERYREIAATVAAVARGPGVFENKSDAADSLQKLRDDLRETGKEIESLKDQRVPIEKLLNFKELAGADTQLGKIRDLIASIPKVLAEAGSKQDVFSQFGVVKTFEDQLRELGVVADRELKDVYNGFNGVGDVGRQRFVEVKTAVQLLQEVLAAADKKASDLGVSLARAGDASKLVDYSSAVKKLVEERERELRIAELTGVERERASLFVAAERLTGQQLTETEKEKLTALAKQVVESQKIAEARKREAQEADRVAKQQADLPRNLEDLQRKYADQLRVAQAIGEQRELILADIEAENDAKQIGLGLDTEAFAKLREAARERARLRFNERQDQRAAPTDRRQEEAITRLRQEQELLARTGADREKYRNQIEAETAAREAGFKVGTDEYRDYVRKKTALSELADTQRKVAEAGAQAGETVGDFLSRVIIDGEKAGVVIRSLLQDLQRMALRYASMHLLQSAGLALFGGAPSNSGNGSQSAIVPGIGEEQVMALGGVIPAQTGQIVDSYSMLRRGGRTYSVAEGGASTPEAIFPLQRDGRGRLGVAAAGAGGPNVTMVLPGIRNQSDARASRATISQRLRQVLSEDRRGRRGLRPAGA